MENYIGEIKLFAGDYAPVDWAICDGKLLRISDYMTLYTLLGNTFGGDGINTFALPDLKGRVCVGAGDLSINNNQYILGQCGGNDMVTLIEKNLPTHYHVVMASPEDATTSDPTDAFLAVTNGNNGYSDVQLYSPQSPGYTSIYMDDNAITISETGSFQPHNNMMPFVSLNYIIAINGIYPSPE